MTKDNKVRFTLRIPKTVYDVLAHTATQKGIATNSEISDILWRHIKKTEAGGERVNKPKGEAQ